jgi:hypothetical protein
VKETFVPCGRKAGPFTRFCEITKPAGIEALCSSATLPTAQPAARIAASASPCDAGAPPKALGLPASWGTRQGWIQPGAVLTLYSRVSQAAYIPHTEFFFPSAGV